MRRPRRGAKPPLGLALHWWLEQLESATTRQALLERHGAPGRLTRIAVTAPYVGRFAPSPTGPLHAGSLVAALASWLDARAHGGRWLVRIEDVDTPRSVAGAAEASSRSCALRPGADEPPVLAVASAARCTSRRSTACMRDGRAYPCGCTRERPRAALAAPRPAAPRHAELVYPGTCRDGLHGKAARALRLRTDLARRRRRREPIVWHDRRLGCAAQDVAARVGDFVLRRADGLWAYQLAVVVDDAAQGITDVVRGEDLADNTARQILLQRRLGLPTPRYLHTPLVLVAERREAVEADRRAGARPGATARSPAGGGRRARPRRRGTSLAEWLAPPSPPGARAGRCA